MGAVAVDLHKGEREWQNLTLSDEKVVRYFILYRSRRDVVYNANSNINIQTGDTFDFNQELIALYASLDKIIEKCNFKEKQTRLLELLFEGNSITDVIGHYGFAQKTAYRMLDKIIEVIVKQNDSDWKEAMEKQGIIKRC